MRWRDSCKVYCEPEALRPLRPLWLWTALFALAFGVRLVGIGWSLPNAGRHYSYHPDEWLVLLASYFAINPYAASCCLAFTTTARYRCICGAYGCTGSAQWG